MNRYNAQILNDKGEYHLQFETDSRENFDAMERTAQRCMDKKPRTNFDKITESVESLAKWALDTYCCVPPDMPCNSKCDKDCGECFIEWLQKEIEE